MFVSGGSGGHIVPLLSVEQALRALKPDVETHFVCTDKTSDSEMLQRAGRSFTALPKGIFARYAAARKILRTWRPDALFSKGGAVSVPVCFAAKRLRIPIVIHESDAVMGRANRIVSRWAKVVCLGFEEATGGACPERSRRDDPWSFPRIPAFGP